MIMKSVRAIIAIFSILLLIGLYLNMYVFYWDTFNIPKYIPGTPLNISSLFLVGWMIVILIIAEKQMLRIEPALTILKLTIYGALIGFTAEIIYQASQFFIGNSDMMTFVKAVLVVGAYEAVIAFLIAFQLKTKKTRQLIWFIAAIMIITKVVMVIQHGWAY